MKFFMKTIFAIFLRIYGTKLTWNETVGSVKKNDDREKTKRLSKQESADKMAILPSIRVALLEANRLVLNCMRLQIQLENIRNNDKPLSVCWTYLLFCVLFHFNLLNYLHHLLVILLVCMRLFKHRHQTISLCVLCTVYTFFLFFCLSFCCLMGFSRIISYKTILMCMSWKRKKVMQVECMCFEKSVSM